MDLDTKTAGEWLGLVAQEDGLPTMALYAKKLGTTLGKLLDGLSAGTVEPRDIIEAQINDIAHVLEYRMVKHNSQQAYNRLKQPPFNWKPEEGDTQKGGNPEVAAMIASLLFGAGGDKEQNASRKPLGGQGVKVDALGVSGATKGNA